ncbi:DNA ligase D [Roseomonas xinghualingensis]|uniref:DNA ligase D n=1 Tax=Roseomonas xinghualingensis TaxID=2986475 RepID=UPI0021F1DC16|nr:DNA ligase D [Roseomonas sp. SXEYE001]MCV4208982.1 DNA ligase D [Roseomonas sp. SXEYE001]
MAPDPLAPYRAKRDFRSTAEPKGAIPRGRKGKALAFVVQKHDATRLHYDFRLELNGVLKSWAVTRGPSLDPTDKRLAVEVEDHPVEYGRFEGIISMGYGAGTVMLWDRGTWEPASDDPAGDLEKGRLSFTLHGERLHGAWHLVRMRARGRETKHNWLLIKDDDEEARPGDGDALLEEFDRSISTGRDMAAIAGKVAAKSVVSTKRSAPKAVPRKAAGNKTATPGFIPPMLCVLESEAPAGPCWVHEIKLDGYRMLAVIQGGKARLLTRTGQDWSHRFPEVAKALGALPDGVVDGELVAPDKDGNPDFAALQAAMEKGTTGKLRFFAFDLPVQGRKDLHDQPLLKRKAALREMLKTAPPEVVFVEHFTERGDALLRSSCRLGLEGIVSKRANSPYREGRSGDWVKTKCRGNDEFVVGGHGTGAKGRMTLLLGAWRDGKLVYLGRVGSGISGEKAKDLEKQLRGLKRKDSPFANAPADRRATSWVEPRLVAEVDYTGWTADGLLRQASFKGVREDKPAEEVGMPRPGEAQPEPKAAQPASSGRSVVAGVALSHPDKLYWPDEGITKRGLAEYMEAVAPRLLPWVAGRPLSLLRAPDGIKGDRFFQRHAGRGTSALITQVKPRGEKSSLLQVDRMEALVALAQSGTLELHPWPARSETIAQPDRLILDLDPAEDLPFAAVVEAALALRGGIEAMGLAPFCKTTGGKGLHIVVPIAPGASWKGLHDTAAMICKALEAEAPERFTTDNSKAVRGGRIFLDYQRNARGASAVAAWSPRARPGATVSMPLDWSEVTKKLDPRAFTLRTAPGRLKEADPWSGFEAAAKPLPGKSKR